MKGKLYRAKATSDFTVTTHRAAARISEAFGDQSAHRTTFQTNIFFWTVNGPFSFAKRKWGVETVPAGAARGSFQRSDL